MKINDALISKLENLSRLDLSSEEKEIIKNDLNNILGMVEKLQELDTSEVPPLRYMIDDGPGPREDKVVQGNSREALLARAPKSEENHIVIPKVIVKKS